MLDNLVQVSSGVSMVESISDLVWLLGSILGSNHGTPTGLQLIFYILPSSKVTYPDFVVSSPREIIVVPPVEYSLNFVPLIFGTFPTLSQRLGHNKIWCDTKGHIKV